MRLGVYSCYIMHVPMCSHVWGRGYSPSLTLLDLSCPPCGWRFFSNISLYLHHKHLLLVTRIWIHLVTASATTGPCAGMSHLSEKWRRGTLLKSEMWKSFGSSTTWQVQLHFNLCYTILKKCHYSEMLLVATLLCLLLCSSSTTKASTMIFQFAL